MARSWYQRRKLKPKKMTPEYWKDKGFTEPKKELQQTFSSFTENDLRPRP